jgi:hypothetical protein
MRNGMIVALTGILTVGAGCMGKGTSGGGALSVTAKAVSPSAAAATGGLDLGSGIAVDRVQLALRRIGLEGTPSAAAVGAASDGTGDDHGGSGGSSGSSGSSGSGADDGAEDAGEVKVGPFLVDLAGDALASGLLAPAFDGDVPPGTYRELRIVVGPVDPAAATSALAALGGRSVVIAGRIDGEAFTFSSSLTSTQKRESTVIVAASGASSNVTLTISPAGWFTGPGGRLDPRVEANRSAIEARIAASIDAFGDDDHDGIDDATEHHGGDDGAGHR